MKRIARKLTALLLSALMVGSVVTAGTASAGAAAVAGEKSVGASSGTTGDCTWTLDDSGVLTISGEGAMGNYSESVAPWGKGITSTVIENGVTVIGSYAFSGCKGLTSVTIPDSVTSIGEEAFRNCTGLTKIVIPESVGFIQDNAFSGCNNVTIFGKNGSYAQTYADANQLNFKAIVPEFAVGDSNGDGKIDIKDATTIQKCIAKISALTPEQQKAADANGDGKVDINDATLIQKYLAKYIDRLG
jgi:surface glycoprotein (TIGR04207 family)